MSGFTKRADMPGPKRKAAKRRTGKPRPEKQKSAGTGDERGTGAGMRKGSAKETARETVEGAVTGTSKGGTEGAAKKTMKGTVKEAGAALDTRDRREG